MYVTQCNAVNLSCNFQYEFGLYGRVVIIAKLARVFFGGQGTKLASTYVADVSFLAGSKLAFTHAGEWPIQSKLPSYE